jgi:hypothetical protein
MTWLNRNFGLTPLAAVFCFAAASAAWAQSAPQVSAEALEAARSACAADLQRFCAGVPSGGGRILACLKQNRDQVSPGCKQAVLSALQGAQGGASAAAPVEPSQGAALPEQRSAAAAAAPPSGAASAAPAATAHGASGAPHYFTLKRMQASLKDGDVEKMKVFTLLAPADWTLDGGFRNKADVGSCFSDMIQVQGLVRPGQGFPAMAVVPRTSFRWADDPAVRKQMEDRDRFDARNKLVDCPIQAPMRAADFLRENFVWKFHKEKPQVTAEPFPELEQLVRAQLGLGPQGDGSTRVDVAHVHASYTDEKSGQPMDEWWSGAIVVRTFPVAGRGLGYEWHAEQVTVFQAPKGQADRYDKLYRVMATSVRLDPQFVTWSNGIISKLSAARAQEIAKQNAAIAQFQQHVVETIQGVTANAQRGAQQAAYGQDQLVRGVQTFRDPSSGRTVELSNLYDHAWSNGNDQYVVTDDPNFNPNGRVNGDWGQLELVRPQP